jgi:hypothetical protein
MFPDRAARESGTCRQQVWDLSRVDPGFERDHQLAKDRGWVERLIRDMDRKDVRVFDDKKELLCS